MDLQGKAVDLEGRLRDKELEVEQLRKALSQAGVKLPAFTGLCTAHNSPDYVPSTVARPRPCAEDTCGTCDPAIPPSLDLTCDVAHKSWIVLALVPTQAWMPSLAGQAS